MTETYDAQQQLVDYNIRMGEHPVHDPDHRLKSRIEDLSFWYGQKQALFDINLDIYDQEVTAFVGPSGCGKTTLLKCLNRTNEIIPDARLTGRVLLDGEDIYASDLDPTLLRRRIGWVAQKPNPFPWSVYNNVAYGARLHGLVSGKDETDELVRGCLERAGLWDEVKDRLREPGTDLSGGQQQRLCVARALSNKPDIILMDEPASALDPHATAHLEDLIDHLRQRYCIIIITHNMQQAARVSQRTAYFHLGRMLEFGDTEELFLRPQNESCRAYITGLFG